MSIFDKIHPGDLIEDKNYPGSRLLVTSIDNEPSEYYKAYPIHGFYPATYEKHVWSISEEYIDSGNMIIVKAD